MTKKDLLKKIEQLEKRVQELEERPSLQITYPLYQPIPIITPQNPLQPAQPWPWPYEIICSSNSKGVATLSEEVISALDSWSKGS